VFDDPARLSALNSIVHPEVRRLWTAWLAGVGPGSKAAIVIIPLLYEIGDDANWDTVICVSAPEEDQMRRLLARGLSEREAGRRLSAQMSVLEKMERADYVIYNTGTVELLKKQTGRVVSQLLEA
jgi:dephospho-CoA kinase